MPACFADVAPLCRRGLALPTRRRCHLMNLHALLGGPADGCPAGGEGLLCNRSRIDKHKRRPWRAERGDSFARTHELALSISPRFVDTALLCQHSGDVVLRTYTLCLAALPLIAQRVGKVCFASACDRQARAEAGAVPSAGVALHAFTNRQSRPARLRSEGVRPPLRFLGRSAGFGGASLRDRLRHPAAPAGRLCFARQKVSKRPATN